MRAVGNRRAKERKVGKMDTIEAGGLSVHFFRPGNKITEAVIVFDYRIVLGLLFLISPFGSQ